MVAMDLQSFGFLIFSLGVGVGVIAGWIVRWFMR